MTLENELLSMLQTAISNKKAVDEAISQRNQDIRTLLYKQQQEAYEKDEQLIALKPQSDEWGSLIKQTAGEVFNTGTVVRSGAYIHVVDHTDDITYYGLTLWGLPVTDPPTRRKRYERIQVGIGMEIISLNDLTPRLREIAERLIARLRLKVWAKKNESA